MGGFKMAVIAPPRRATTRVAPTSTEVAPTSTDGMRRQDRHWRFAAALCTCLLVTTPGGAETPVTPAATPTAPLQTFQDCSDCPEMVVVPAGKFVMGSEHDYDNEKPAHEVTISRSFAVGKFEVTFAEWQACVTAGGCASNKSPSDEGWGGGRRPVINVSWNDAKEYVTWLSGKTRQPYRLLTEAEWEYAARAGTTTKYAFGDTITDEQGLWGASQTADVGSFPPNPWGLHDMHGNVWEWVEDCYQNDYNDAPSDGTARPSADCALRVLRGGSWDDDHPQYLRSSFRYMYLPGYRFGNIGFRVARGL